MTLYRISWLSLHTNARGHGQFLFSDLNDLEQVVRTLNREHSEDLRHWIEYQNDAGLLECILVSDRADEEIRAGGEQCGTGTVRTVDHRETGEPSG